MLTVEERIVGIADCRYVHQVIGNAPLLTEEGFLREHRIDLVVHGHDMWNSDRLRRFYAEPRRLGTLRLVPYTARISTTEILARIEERFISTPSGREA
jgi:glycerol-3-phosphate cytidylyltransferase-like family protein